MSTEPLRALGASCVLAFALFFGCEPRVTTIGVADSELAGTFLEAESGQLSGGMLVASESSASGGHFIHSEVGVTSDDVPGAARAEYTLSADQAGTYLIWGRVHNQNLAQNRFWFQLDGGVWTKWRITTGDEWFWDAFHENVDYSTPSEFQLSAGEHRLLIANCVDGAALDRLYFAPNRSTPGPGERVCNPPHSIELDGGCAPSCGSLDGFCYDTPCTDAGQPTYDCSGCCAPKL